MQISLNYTLTPAVLFVLVLALSRVATAAAAAVVSDGDSATSGNRKCAIVCVRPVYMCVCVRVLRTR